MPAETPSRSRIPAPVSKASATPSRLAPPGTTRTLTLRTQKSASSLRPPPSGSVTSPKSPSPTPSASRTRAKAPVTASKPNTVRDAPPPPSLEGGMARLSVKDQVAQRRAMMRKESTKPTTVRPVDGEWREGKGASGIVDEEDALGRGSMLLDITTARTTGKLDLSFRSLQCLPYALFNLHLGTEPSFPPPPSPGSQEKEIKQPAFYECVDLVSLRARDNMIEELQDEISYFVSLKVIDLNRNKLSKLPSTFVELKSLVNLDLAHNTFATIPPELASLAALVSLDISNNPLTSLENLPVTLTVLSASHCQLTIRELNYLPSPLIQLDISHNKLGASPRLSTVLERLALLKSLTAKSCDLDPGDFQGDGWWMTRLSTLELGGPQKEAWELEIERQALRRQQRTAPVASNSSDDVGRKSLKEESNADGMQQGESHILDIFYEASTLTLALPSSRAKPPPPAYIPKHTLPVDVILRHGWTDNVKCLVLTGRNTSPLFTLPADDVDVVLGGVMELKMDDCGLGEKTRFQVAGASTEREDGTFALIARLFPSLRSLDLSYNRLPSLAGIGDVLARRVDGASMGVRELRLKGCGVNNLDELVGLLEDGAAAGDGASPEGWALRELDLSDNAITKLPPKLGLLPVDVLLVDGNLFRIPARRVWEKEGTKGLLDWLRVRME